MFGGIAPMSAIVYAPTTKLNLEMLLVPTMMHVLQRFSKPRSAPERAAFTCGGF